MTCFGLCGDSLGRSGLYKPSSNRRHIHRLLLALLTVLIVVAVVLFVTLYASSSFNQVNFLGKYKSSQPLGIYQHAAVSTDGPGCAKYGRQILERNGTAMDALISVLLCMGVVIPESLGLGGGSFIVYYKRDENRAWAIDGRETAPGAATSDMFTDLKSSSKGPLAMGVPGELAGYWEAHKNFGSLSWNELFEGAIDIAGNGFPVHEHLYSAYMKGPYAQNSTIIKKLFTNPVTGKLYEMGEIMKRLDLVPTFKTLAVNGVDEFYRGSMAKTLVSELRQAGSIITEQDFANYQAKVYEAVNISLSNGMKLYSVDLPGSGPLLGFILNTFLELGKIDKNVGQSLEDSVTYYHRFVEVFKHAYAQRTRLEDRSFGRIESQLQKLYSPEFIKTVASRIHDEKTFPQTYYSSLVSLAKDQGTSHVSIVDKYGNAAAASSTVNGYFGSGIMSDSTGIIFNNEMDDFSSPNITNQYGLPPSDYNKIEPGKRPLSSMCPSVVVNESGEVQIVIGASGGAQITSSVALNIARNQFLGEDIKSTIDAPRLHHQFSPNVIKYESGFPKNILAELQDRGHKVEVITGRSSIVMAVARSADGKLTANADYRKGGSIDGY